MKRSRSVTALLWLTLSIFTLPSNADETASSTDETRTVTESSIGFAGHYRLGRWTPFSFSNRSAQPTSLTAPDDEGTATHFVWNEKPLPTAGCIRIGRPLSGLQAPSQPVLNSQQLAIVVGDALQLSPVIRLQQRDATEQLVATNIPPSQLARDWFAYDGVDLLVIPTSDLELLERVSDEQWEAMRTWVRMGGKLLLSVGTNAANLLNDDHPLAEFAPGQFAQVINQRETSGLETYAAPSRRAATTRIELTDEDGRFVGLSTVTFVSGDGVSLCRDGRGQTQVNWVVQRAFGLGSVTFVAADLDAPPLSNWEGHSRLLAKLVRDTLHGREDETASFESQSVTHFGFDDISGQLRAALEQFSGVRVVPFGLIGLIAVGFAVSIGPLDYLLLGRHAKRSKWTWVTSSLMVLIATAGIWVLAGAWKGGQLMTNQVTLVDLDASTGTLRGTNWTHVYTPSTTEVSARFAAAPQVVDQATVADHLVAWHGLAGDGFGGMSSTAPTTAAAQLTAYEIPWTQTSAGWSSHVDGMLIPKWSSRRFAALWTARWSADPTQLTTAPRSGLLMGTITNPLNVTLKSPYICFDRWKYELDDLAPGQQYRLNQSEIPADLKSRLTDRRIMDSKQIASPWNEESMDVLRIMEMVMFHDAAGGRSYTSLLHRQAAWLDMSDHLRLNRAVLVGRVADAPATLEVEGSGSPPATQHWQICRVVFEVKPPAK